MVMPGHVLLACHMEKKKKRKMKRKRKKNKGTKLDSDSTICSDPNWQQKSNASTNAHTPMMYTIRTKTTTCLDPQTPPTYSNSI
mmetsp:Transcript_36012/g.52730  ORF Transcript_36012/g.52730 Transcript_36012/m.52730 type:complete len:84 (+) Transcript_36012:972-1223(+)